MSPERNAIPEGASSITDDDFAFATDRVNAVRDMALSDPRVAAVVETRTALIDRRVQTLAALRKARGSPRRSCPRS